MTDSQASAEGRGSLVDARAEQQLRQAGREFLVGFYAALRNLKLYPIENEQAQRSLDDLVVRAKGVFQVEKELEVRVAGEFLFVNATRLRLDLDNFATFGHVLTTFRQAGVGRLEADQDADRREWQVLISLILSAATQEAAPGKIQELQQKLAQGDVTRIRVEPPIETDEDLEDHEKAKEVAKRTYEQTVTVTKEVINSVRMGRTASLKKVKRAVQGIVDQVLKNEVSMVGLTTIRGYDEYTFTHSVNVTIFSVSIGKRLGLSKLQLYDLGLAALFHDLGKSRVPLEVLNKEGPLSDDEWRIMQAHPWLGVLTLFGLRGYGEIPYRPMITAFEHHMKVDLTGYPKTIRPRELSVFSKVVAVADAFDAATTRRSYQTVPLQPDQVLREMWENPRRGQDPVLVKALINLTGIYPVGTCVILDSYEVGVVHSANPDPSQLNRPVVRIVLTAEGARIEEGPLADLAEVGAGGGFKRTIIKVTDPAAYGINPSDYFV
jgi:HD-GYP domain-containing protein (c-di-GMP phosphodiesterase class II)